MEIFRVFQIEAAHYLPNVPEGHKCRRMHGNSFKVEISVEGEVDEEIGWVYDHKRISDAMAPLLEETLFRGLLYPAIRDATDRAAMRRGWVCPIMPATPRPSSRQILGSWVDLPEPERPLMMISFMPPGCSSNR